MKTTWKAAIPIKFANATVADLKRLLGTVLPHEPEYVPPPFEKTKFKYADTDIPDSFDVRTGKFVDYLLYLVSVMFFHVSMD